MKEKGVNILTLYKGVPCDKKRLKNMNVLSVGIDFCDFMVLFNFFFMIFLWFS